MLEDAQGLPITDQEGLERVCSQYYADLYTEGVHSPEQEAAATQALGCIGDRLTEDMKAILRAPVSLAELSKAVKEMAVGKAPGPDGVIMEFFKLHWDLIKHDYLKMITEATASGNLPPVVTRGLIALLHKGDIRSRLTNWRPITLLNVGYKVFAKILQLRVQPILMEVISFDQSAFLPMRLILDNIMLTHETMDWANHTGQPLIFLKLDFSKAFDMVDWKFLFRAMSTLGFPQEFICMTRMLLEGAEANVKVNGSVSPPFSINRGVRQGCPLAPYLFLIAAEVLNAMVKKGMDEGRVKGITLPLAGREQIIAQFADDTSFTLQGEEVPVKEMINILDSFCLASGLVLNWHKSCGYWKHGPDLNRPDWTNDLNITWIDDNCISKLLGTPYGLSIASQDVDEFLLGRVMKKLQYWSTTKINSTGRGVIVNTVLLSSLVYFTSIWGGTQAGVKKITSAIKSFMWSGSLHRARAKVAWAHCCLSKPKGGINLINPFDSLNALMVKWLVKACEPGDSNLHVLLRHRLSNYQPYSQGRWGASLEYFTVPNCQAKKGSSAWSRVGSAWKILSSEVKSVLPCNFEELKNESLWWSPFLPLIGAGFSKLRAAQLHKQGLKSIRDVMVGSRFLSFAEPC